MIAQVWATVVVGLLATAGVLATLWQRQLSEATDRRHRTEVEARAEWWRRYEFAVGAALSTDLTERDFGVAILDSLTSSPLVTASEAGIIAATSVTVEPTEESSPGGGGEDG